MRNTSNARDDSFSINTKEWSFVASQDRTTCSKRPLTGTADLTMGGTRPQLQKYQITLHISSQLYTWKNVFFFFVPFLTFLWFFDLFRYSHSFILSNISLFIFHIFLGFHSFHFHLLFSMILFIQFCFHLSLSLILPFYPNSCSFAIFFMFWWLLVGFRL